MGRNDGQHLRKRSESLTGLLSQLTACLVSSVDNTEENMAEAKRAFRSLAEIKPEEFNEIFAEATRQAAQKAWEAGLSVCGLVDGKLALVHPDQSVTFL